MSSWYYVSNHVMSMYLYILGIVDSYLGSLCRKVASVKAKNQGLLSVGPYSYNL